MFEFLRNHMKWLMVLFLGLTFVAFLVPQGYSSFLGDAASKRVASVDGKKITQAEWDAAQRQASERLRAQNPDIDAKLLDSEEFRFQSLEGLVQQRVLDRAAQTQHLNVANERLRERFVRDPQMEWARLPNGGLNKAVAAAQGLSETGFIERYRQDLRNRQVVSPIQSSGTGQEMGQTVAAGLAFDALLQQREVRIQHFTPQEQMARVQVSDADVEAFYKEADTQKKWLRPESAQIEYAVLDVEALKATVKVSEAELRAFYDQNASRYSTAEERRARHILLTLDAKAPEDSVKAAQEKANKLLAELRKAPDQFAELARKNSQDEVSAVNGGDLDFFARGAMTKVFEDAAFALKVGEISPIVRSEFGLHIIKLDAVRGGERRAFEVVRAEIEGEQRTELARQRFRELSETFSTMVFEQPDSLAPVAEKLGLTVQRATVQRNPQAGQQGPLASAKLMESVFSTDTLRNKRNTDAVETAPNQLTSARVLQYQPAAAPALAEVKEPVRQQLLMKRASELAKKAGDARRAKGSAAGDDGLLPAQWVSRAQPQGLSQPVIEALLRADGSKLPAWVGVDQKEAGYWLIKVEKLGGRAPDILPPDVAARQYAQAWAAVEGRAYLEALKLTHKVKMDAKKSVAAKVATP
ncbi:MAG: peptidylprolyl isomerase [Inhella sp.]